MAHGLPLSPDAVIVTDPDMTTRSHADWPHLFYFRNTLTIKTQLITDQVYSQQERGRLPSSSSGKAIENAKCPAKAPAMQAMQMYPLKSMKIIMINRLNAFEAANSKERITFCFMVILPLYQVKKKF